MKLSTQEDGIGTLRVNRPEARNALNWTAQEQFAAAVAVVERDTAVRVLIITGTGDKAFVSGGDLKELSQHPEREAGERLNRVMRDALVQLTHLPIPVIAAVNGDAFGGGCEILTACDLRLATSCARFCFAQVRNALCTGWGGTGRLVNLLGQARALDLLLTSCIFSAEEARQMGLVQQVVDDGVGLGETFCFRPGGFGVDVLIQAGDHVGAGAGHQDLPGAAPRLAHDEAPSLGLFWRGGKMPGQQAANLLQGAFGGALGALQCLRCRLAGRFLILGRFLGGGGLASGRFYPGRKWGAFRLWARSFKSNKCLKIACFWLDRGRLMRSGAPLLN